MKYIKQFMLILLVSLAGEALNALLPLPIPASIYGLVLMLLCLCTRIIPLEAVRDAGKFLIEIMPLMFIPAAVGLIDAWPTLRPLLAPYAVITAVSTFVVMLAAGRTVQAVLRYDRKKVGK